MRRRNVRVLNDADDADFRAFVHARSSMLMRSAYLLTGDVQLAQDLLQSVLAKTALHWAKASALPDAYVRKALYHEAVSTWRRRRLRPESLPGVLPERVGTRDVSDDVDRRIVVRKALALLTPKQRAVLVLRFFEDLSEADAAAALGCAVGTVKSQTRHALQRLRTVAPELADFLKPAEVDS
jgi:RNA polymerase sigma-70 factor (sigma-E family)